MGPGYSSLPVLLVRLDQVFLTQPRLQGGLEGTRAIAITPPVFLFKAEAGSEQPLASTTHLRECIPVLQVCPHPPAPSPKKGEGEPAF
jgi:hypothetical protein